MELEDHNINDTGNDARANAYRVDDDDNLDEKDLKRSYIFGDSEEADAGQPGMEGEGMGGQNFGKSSVTTSGDDPANPSRNAGYENEYFRRTEPSEEHPENNNFKPDSSNSYEEGTADYDGGTLPTPGVNIQEKENNPEQHKIGEQPQNEPGKTEYNKDADERSAEEKDHLDT